MRSSLVSGSLLMGTALALATPSMAGGVNQIPSISSAVALQATTAAQDACLKMGFHVSVTVVDAGGAVLATVREDGAAPHTVTTSQRKAYTALSSRMPTTQLTKLVGANPDAFGMREVDGFLVLNGGLPIKLGDNVIGAIGVSGSPGPDNDDKCAAAGLGAIQDKLK